MWEWAKKVLNAGELINDMLLEKDDKEMTAFHHATFSGNLLILGRIWKWAIEQLTPEEIEEFILAQNTHKRTAWIMAVRGAKQRYLKNCEIGLKKF